MSAEIEIPLPPGSSVTVVFSNPAPITEVAAPPTLTCQRLINALAVAGRALGYGPEWWSWLAERPGIADLLLSSRGKLYAGPPLEAMYGRRELSEIHRALGG